MITVEEFIKKNFMSCFYIIVDTKEYDEDENFVREKLSIKNYGKHKDRNVDAFDICEEQGHIMLFVD